MLVWGVKGCCTNSKFLEQLWMKVGNWYLFLTLSLAADLSFISQWLPQSTYDWSKYLLRYIFNPLTPLPIIIQEKFLWFWTFIKSLLTILYYAGLVCWIKSWPHSIAFIIGFISNYCITLTNNMHCISFNI